MTENQTSTEQLFQRGQSLRVNGAYDEAIAVLHDTLAGDADHAGAYLELGLAYCFTGLFDESIQALEHAVALAPANAEYHLHLAKTYTMLGMYDEGAAAFHAVVALSLPGDASHEEALKQLAYFPSG